MNRILEECSTSQTIPSWMIEYQQKIAIGISPDELMESLEEELNTTEYQMVWNHSELENLSSVVEMSKPSIHYEERYAYLQNLKNKEYHK